MRVMHWRREGRRAGGEARDGSCTGAYRAKEGKREAGRPPRARGKDGASNGGLWGFGPWRWPPDSPSALGAAVAQAFLQIYYDASHPSRGRLMFVESGSRSTDQTPAQVLPSRPILQPNRPDSSTSLPAGSGHVHSPPPQSCLSNQRPCRAL